MIYARLNNSKLGVTRSTARFHIHVEKSHLNHAISNRFLAALSTVAIASVSYAAPETPIPRSMPGDKGQYYLLESKKNGDVVTALHKRVGVDSVGFTRTETNCKTRQMRELGYGEDSLRNIKGPATKWFPLVPGSSKSDLAAFVCKW